MVTGVIMSSRIPGEFHFPFVLTYFPNALQ